MIPHFGLGDVLPPFMGEDATGGILPRSPYRATLEEVVETFCTSPERAAILRGLLAFREALRAEGFEAGFQWLDGSFVEDCERVKGRPPGDVDVVNLLHRPPAKMVGEDWETFVNDRIDTLFDPSWTKANFACDAYFIDLDSTPALIADFSAYWIGLFSHQRDTFRWKGMLRVDFGGDDASAADLLAAKVALW